ncbi:UNVERIFIED_CONTAM: Gld [Trichonephila clavipes]
MRIIYYALHSNSRWQIQEVFINAQVKYSYSRFNPANILKEFLSVGAGTAGSVLATRLAEKDCVTVLLLEAGKSPPKVTDIPTAARSFIQSDIDWNYSTAPQKHTGVGLVNRSVAWPSGKTIGGGSVISGMLNFRGNKKNYDDWAAEGASGWSYEEVLPYFMKLEDNTDEEYFENGTKI